MGGAACFQDGLMTSASTPAAPSSWRARFAGGAAVRLESLLLLAGLCMGVAVLWNAFLSVSNILNILLSTSVFGVLAIGMTFVISSAGIDLSVGSILALSGVAGAMLTSDFNLPWWVGVLGCLTMGALTGAFNGFLITRGAIPPFIVTLGMLGVARGFALVLSNGISIYGYPRRSFGLGRVGRSACRPRSLFFCSRRSSRMCCSLTHDSASMRRSSATTKARRARWVSASSG